jgi:hypothetical protein
VPASSSNVSLDPSAWRIAEAFDAAPKSANILITDGEHAKIVDFGLAKQSAWGRGNAEQFRRFVYSDGQS